MAKSNESDEWKNKKSGKSLSYTKYKARKAAIFMRILLEARSYKGDGGRPFISPQEFEIGVYLISLKLRSTRSYKTRFWKPKLSIWALDYARKTNYGGGQSVEGELPQHPSESVMQRAFKKLAQLGLICYEMDYFKPRNEKNGYGPTIKFLDFKYRKVDDILSENR